MKDTTMNTNSILIAEIKRTSPTTYIYTNRTYAINMDERSDSNPPEDIIIGELNRVANELWQEYDGYEVFGMISKIVTK
jgi:hypothetical protein